MKERQKKMDWDDLAYFVSLVKHQTLTACAEKLGVQHSTVSRRIERLESTLNLKLFDHLGKRYSLTNEGELLYAQALEVQAQVDTFQRMAIDNKTLQGEVTISVPPVLANERIVPHLFQFSTQYPNITLQILGDVHLSNLHRREADIAIRLQRPTHDDLVLRRLGIISSRFYAHKDYLAKTPYQEWRWIEFTGNSQLLAWQRQVFQAFTPLHASVPKVIFSSNDLYMVAKAISQSLGAGLLPLLVAQSIKDLLPINPLSGTKLADDGPPEPQSNASVLPNNLVHSQIPKAVIPMVQSRPMYLVMHPDVRRSARVRVVADWLIDILK